MNTIFGNFDISNFWDNDEYALREYVGQPLNENMLAGVERELGCKLPDKYVEFLRNQNGGTPRKTSHKTTEVTSWANDHIAITGIFGADKSKRWSLCGQFGSNSAIKEWGYPPIGVYFCDCPSAGHDMLCLDYSKCGPSNEPRVVHVDQEIDYKITLVAESFEQFIRGLQPADAF